jgi:hypothetical protein
VLRLNVPTDVLILYIKDGVLLKASPNVDDFFLAFVPGFGNITGNVLTESILKVILSPSKDDVSITMLLQSRFDKLSVTRRKVILSLSKDDVLQSVFDPEGMPSA